MKPTPAKVAGSGRGDAKRKRAEQLRQGNRKRDTYNRSKSREFHPVVEDEPDDVTSLRADCHADAELTSPLPGGKAHDRVHTCPRQQQRRNRKPAKQKQNETPIYKSPRDQVLQRGRVVNRLLRIKRPDLGRRAVRPPAFPRS
jgi:hypothetical protein